MIFMNLWVKRLLLFITFQIYFSSVCANKEATKGPVITNISSFGNGIIQVGDAIACYSLAKILSIKYNIPFCYSHFHYHDLFNFSDYEKSDLTEPIWASHRKRILVLTEQDILNNLGGDVTFFVELHAKIDYISSEWYETLKKGLALKAQAQLNPLPQNCVTIAIHIRKGNGGGQLYDGELQSEQEFEFDRSIVHYDSNFENFPFDWPSFERKNGYLIHDWNFKTQPTILDKVPYIATKFPPNQYYIDVLRKLSDDLSDRPLFVQLFTDDKEPQALLALIKNYVNKPNISFFYNDNRHLAFKDRILQDLQALSLFDVLVRPQSYFTKIAEMIGHHKIVICPFNYQWQENKLIMHHIIVKGSIQELLHD